MNKKDKLYKLIVKELLSEISESDKVILEKELSDDPETRAGFSILKNYWNKFYLKTHENRIIEKTELKLGFSDKKQTRFKSTSLLIKIAASFLLIISLIYSGYQFSKTREKLILHDYRCGPGQIKEIILCDGTKIWLNSMSYLQTAEPFTGKYREVILMGEAYFEVAHKSRQAFLVKTPQLNTIVLGTHFNIIAYPTDKYQEISLYEGKVQLHPEIDSKQNILLKPGDRVYYNSKTGKLKISKTDKSNPAPWREGILSFYNESLFSIARKLERKFHTRIFITDKQVGRMHFTAEFKDETLLEIIELLNKAQKFKTEETDEGILIGLTERVKN